jgi:membrane-bound lytic murein transglycosylase B
MHEHANLLQEVGLHYGVDPAIIVALWGIESNFGRNIGGFDTLDALATLAYEGRRADFFRKELIDALRILDQQHMPADMLRGSWAGAMGQCQFMPSTYLRYAVSYGGRSPDIWDDTADVFASIANYIVADGWDGSQTWGREVALDKAIPDDQIGLNYKQPLSDWARMGVHDSDGGDLPDQPMEASLIAPDGPDGRHFLVYDNFRALMRWNHSTFFAASVGLLADNLVTAR